MSKGGEENRYPRDGEEEGKGWSYIRLPYRSGGICNRSCRGPMMLAAKKQSIESSPVNDAPRQGLIAHGLQSLRPKRRRPEETKRLIVEETDEREVEEVRSFRVKQGTWHTTQRCDQAGPAVMCAIAAPALPDAQRRKTRGPYHPLYCLSWERCQPVPRRSQDTATG